MKRNIHVTQAFQLQADELQAVTRRTDEFLDGARWVLEREPERGERVQCEPAIHRLCLQPQMGHPPVALHYRIDFDKIVLLSLTSV